MKLVRYGPAGKEKPGLIDADGKLRDLSRKVEGHRRRRAVARVARTRCASSTPKQLPLVKGQPRLGPCVGSVGKFVAIGLNFIDHAKETGSPIPEHPIVFFKATNVHRRARTTTIMLPKDSTQHRLGSRARHRHRHARRATSTKKDALRYVAGYCVCNDVSEREFQIKKGGGAVGQGQGLRHVRPARPVAGHHRRDQGSAEPRHVAQGQRRDAAERQHEHDDLRRREARRRRVALHDAASPAT